jgi:1-acyl-sn-glycerol-3-phosphate acyltransferase
VNRKPSLLERINGRLWKLWGWKLVGNSPDLKKFLIIVAPHTSNWDFFVGYLSQAYLDFSPNFLAKKELFSIPLVGWFLKRIGGYPVHRSKKTNMVDQVVELYRTEDEFVMTVTPEGTRSYAPEWKTGFYRIAEKANVPIVKVAFDYATKTMSIADPVYTRGEMEKEIEELKEYYRQFKGKHPELGVK